MYTYTCKCGTEWTVRNREEPWTVTCPSCKMVKRTQGRRQKGKEPGKADKHFNDLSTNFPKKNK